MKRKSNSVVSILLRYIILVAVAVPNLWLFYKVFTPLTVYPVQGILSLFFDAPLISGNIIILNRLIPIEIIPSCVAGSAYYLLLMLNLFTPEIEIKKRFRMVISAFAVFLVVNIIRIVALSAMAYSNFTLFDITHKLFWYVMSTLFVVGIWFYQVKHFNIQKIPLYSDLKFLYNKSRRK